MSASGTRRSFALWLLKRQVRTLLTDRQSDLNLFRNQKGIIDINPEIPNRALNLGMIQQELDGSEIASSPLDYRHFGAPQGMSAVGKGIQANRTKPGCQQASVLTRRHWLSSIDSAREQRLTLVQILLPQPAPHSLPGVDQRRMLPPNPTAIKGMTVLANS
jgi:hypothetical protein